MPGAPDRGFDLVATLPLPGGEVRLYVECKKEVRPGVFGAFAEGKRRSLRTDRAAVPVLAAPFVSPRVAELCVEHGWSWYDLAGNCRIDVPGAIYLERRGLAPVHRPPRAKANMGTPEAGRVVRALLAPENAGVRWTQRSLREHFERMTGPPIPEPSLGLVNKVVQFLREEAYLEVLEDGGFRLRDPEKLLFAWRDAYRFDRHERRGYFTLLRGARLKEALYDLELEAGGLAAYAAFSAADYQAPHVRQGRTWIHIRREHIGRFEALAEAKRVESGENVVVLIPDDDGVFYMRDGGTVGEHRMGCTNPVQTWVDISHCGGRGAEAAEALLEQRLKPGWQGGRA